jgi:putative transposase
VPIGTVPAQYVGQVLDWLGAVGHDGSHDVESPVVRHEDTLTCPCEFEGHADLTASETFLRENSDTEVRPMARPVRFEWDDHEWSGKPYPHESPKEVRTNPQVASVGR